MRHSLHVFAVFTVSDVSRFSCAVFFMFAVLHLCIYNATVDILVKDTAAIASR